MGFVFWRPDGAAFARGRFVSDILSHEVRSVWCVSDGRAGIERQTIAIANALSELIAIETNIVHLNPKGPQTWLPPQFWPAPLAALP